MDGLKEVLHTFQGRVIEVNDGIARIFFKDEQGLESIAELDVNQLPEPEKVNDMYRLTMYVEQEPGQKPTLRFEGKPWTPPSQETCDRIRAKLEASLPDYILEDE